MQVPAIFVHLSADIETAIKVGSRHGKTRRANDRHCRHAR